VQSKIWKWIVIVVMMAIIGFGSLFFIGSEPPALDLAMAREEIALSENQLVTSYSKNTVKKANEYYDSAMYYWQQENLKIKYFRDYSFSKLCAEKAVSLAQEARISAKKKGAAHFSEMEYKFLLTKRKLERYQNIFGNHPKSESQIKSLANATMYYNEALVAFDNKNMHVAEIKIADSSSIINELLSTSEANLKKYFASFNEWEKLEKLAIETSKKRNQFVLLIDKYDRTCYIYRNGKSVKTFDIELGKNWIGDKLHAGDKTTPEGTYKVVKKKANGSTKYYKALLLNYPNDEDKARFKTNKEKELIAQSRSIGNLIEIHGDGGKSVDWTDGCVALTNSDMDELFKMCNEETPVFIVGSLQPIEKILK
jgi:murein L,D-transpeptidase YafK